jgi:hypothetical protein
VEQVAVVVQMFLELVQAVAVVLVDIVQVQKHLLMTLHTL